MSASYDAILVVSFGGPEGPDDVIPFLENVLRGKHVPRERMLEVAEHYAQFGGVSPINSQNRALIAALETELAAHGPRLPVFWGNRNWHPLLPDTLAEMRDQGIRRALAFFTSAFSSYSGCRQYRENIQAACEQIGPDAPEVDRIRMFFNHPGFIEPMVEAVSQALAAIPPERHGTTRLVFTAHSIPVAMAQNCQYEAQLHEASRLVAAGVGQQAWDLVYQSRSGPPQQPWLEPDVCDFIRALHTRQQPSDLVLLPIGFVADHLEVLYDLDTEALAVCEELEITLHRVPTVGTHPRFVTMIRELIEERIAGAGQRLVLGNLEPCHDVCPDDCCLYTPRRPGGAA